MEIDSTMSRALQKLFFSQHCSSKTRGNTESIVYHTKPRSQEQHLHLKRSEQYGSFDELKVALKDPCPYSNPLVILLNIFH